jgi:hypothetical protein
MKKLSARVVFGIGCIAWAVGFRAVAAADVRLNQIQVIGSHNSYHVAPYPTVRALIAKAGRGHAEGLDYTHRLLAEQFSELGIRQIELDIFADPKGGLYALPKVRAVLEGMGKDAGPDPNAKGVLDRPGFKVLHVPGVDFRTTTPTFAEALKQVRAWSRLHPRHVPIMVLVELKDEPDSSQSAPFDKAQIDAIDAEILAVFERPEVLTPDAVRGDFATLPEAIAKRGWPSLDAVRGKVMFALDNEDRLRELYLDGHPALRDRVMFASVAPTHAAAAWFKMNDPVRDFDKIRELVRLGFMVRTRADANTTQARKNDGSMRDKALASGAQFVSTDYPEPNLKFSPYVCRLPGGVVARANPVSGRDVAVAGDLEAAGP